MSGKIADTYVAISYKDGAGIRNRFDEGVYGPRDNHRQRSPTGSLCTAFPVEVMAVLRCTELLLPTVNTVRGTSYTQQNNIVTTHSHPWIKQKNEDILTPEHKQQTTLPSPTQRTLLRRKTALCTTMTHWAGELSSKTNINLTLNFVHDKPSNAEISTRRVRAIHIVGF